MAYIGTYVRQLLANRETVTLPGFGSLVTAVGKPGTEGPRMEPPGVVIRFDAEHPRDDGKLATAYANGESLELEEAKQQVLELVDAIKFKLDKGERYTLDEVGTFSRDDNNKIHFAKDPGWVLDPDLFGLPPLELLEIDEVEEEAEASIKEENTQTDGKATSEDQSNDKATPPNTEDVTKQRKKPSRGQRKPVNKWRIIWIIIGSLIAVLVAILLIPVEGDGNGVKIGREGIVIKSGSNSVQDKRAERKKAAREKQDKLQQEDRELKQDEAQEIMQPEETEPVKEAVAAERHFHIIVGSFGSLQNAQRLMNELIGKGFEAQMIQTDDRLYRVSIQSFTTEAEADGALPQIRQMGGFEKAWVGKY